MNQGIVSKIFTGELIVSHQYRDSDGKRVIEDLKIHPFYERYKWEEGMVVNFMYANECYRHYPESCQCKNLRTYALPVFDKKVSIWRRLFGWLMKKK
jgi:hypothetical protein